MNHKIDWNDPNTDSEDMLWDETNDYLWDEKMVGCSIRNFENWKITYGPPKKCPYKFEHLVLHQ